ncbi:MAG: sugar phosphate nucleotidyltransferase [Methylobacter sp.]
MKAVILAGGQGTRLHPLTENIPKPMVNLLGRPIMEHIVHHLRSHGFTDLLATLYFRPRVIRDHFADGSDFSVNMSYTLEHKPLGTAGSVKLGSDVLCETFLVIAGDALTDFDLADFWKFHRSKKAKVSICLKRVPDPGEFGVVVTDEEGRIQRFLEKPGVSEVCSDTVNTGIYLIEPDILARIPEETPYDFAGDLFPQLMADNVPMFAYVAEGYWNDIGTISQLKQSHWDFLDGKLRLPVSGHQVAERVWLGDGARVSEDAELTAPCWVGDNVRIHSSTKIGPYSVICPDVEIDARAMITRSIVMNNSFIGESCDLRNCIIGNNNILEANCAVGDEAVIGIHCHLGRQVSVLPGVLVWPDKEIDGHSTLRENMVWESLLRPSIFASRGISGLANLHITPEYAVTLGKAFGSFLGRGKQVMIARDHHPFSRLIKRAFISGLLSVGVGVDDLEQASLPETRFITGFSRDTDGSTHIRMSDTHSSVAIIELFDGNGLPLVRQARRKIEAVFYRGEFPKVTVDSVGSLGYAGRVHERYAEHLAQFVDQDALSPWRGRVLHDCTEYSLSCILVDLLGSDPVPNHLKEFEPLQTAPYECVAEIAKLNHKIALIIEKNGEQLTLVDELGVVYQPQRIQELLAAAFIASAPAGEPVFLPPDHSKFLDDLVKRHGRRSVITHKDVGAKLNTVYAHAHNNESWLHLTHFYLGYGAVCGALRLLEFLGNKQLTVHEFERQTPLSYRRHLSIPCPWIEMGRVMRELGEYPEIDRDKIPEGLRLDLENGWVYVLPSSDAAQLEITLEADSASVLGELEQDVIQRLRRLVP